MRIADLPARDRPRERLAALGASALSERELLAVVLGTGGAPGLGAHALAERLLVRFGSLRAIAAVHPADLAAVAGIGPAKAAALVAAFELARRGTVTGPPPPRLLNTANLVTLAGPLLRGRPRERLVVAVCDAAFRVLSCEVMTEGGADRSLVPVREVIVAALRRDGQALALAHNHPSGDPTPSGADVDATARVEAAAHAVGLHFLDHVVVTETGWRRVATYR